MLPYGCLLATALGLFLVSGFLGPQFLGFSLRNARPGLRLWAWLGGLYSLAFSSLTALACLAVLIGSGWSNSSKANRGLGDLWYLVLVSALPYIALASLGILIASAITKLQPAVAAAKETTDLLLLKSRESETFRGIPVRILEANHPAAALVVVENQPSILITRGATIDLSKEELDAVLWHELGHALGRHNSLNRLARVACVLTPWLPLTRDLSTVVEHSCEEIADRFALKHASMDALLGAKSKFKF